MYERENDTYDYEDGIKETLARLDERLRCTDEPIQIIHTMLQTLTEYYGADKAYVIEADFDAGYGSGTYEWCKEGIEPRKNIIQYLEADCFPQWKNAFEKSIPIIILDVEEIKSVCLQEYEFYREYGVKSILAVPFSRFSIRGYITVNNPTLNRDDTTFLWLLSHSIVLELNDIRMHKTLKAAARQIPLFTPSDIYINCFGKLEIHNSIGMLADEQFSDQMYGLIGCLALMPNHNATVQQIASFLWPGDTCETAARNIGRILYRLKPLLSIIKLEDLIISKGNMFSFNAKYHIMVDAIIFEAICNKLKSDISKGKAISLYHTALRLYKGELLPRFSHELAVMPYVVYYQNHYLTLQKRVIESAMEQKDYEMAQKVAISTLQIAPFDPYINLYMVILMLIQSGKPVGRVYYEKTKELLPPDHDDIIRQYFPKW